MALIFDCRSSVGTDGLDLRSMHWALRKKINIAVDRSVNLAYYREEDWERFIRSIDDPESMHNTWKEWHEAYLKTKKELIFRGLKVNDFVVDIDELAKYCILQGIKNDGKARSKFVSGSP